MKKDLLKLLDLTSEDILEILDTADQLKAMKKAGIQHPFLAGKTLAMIFDTKSDGETERFEQGRSYRRNEEGSDEYAKENHSSGIPKSY